MNRIAFHAAIALAHALFSVATSSAADGLLGNSPSVDPVYRLDAPRWRGDALRWQPAATLEQTSALPPSSSTAFVPRMSPLDNQQVTDLITTTTNRAFVPPASADRRSEFTALIHPLNNSAQSVSPVIRTSTDINSARASVFSSTRGTIGLSPIHAASSQNLYGTAPSPATLGTLSWQGH